MGEPDFLIIGAARSGTTSLYQYVSQHPTTFMSPLKETDYFAYRRGAVSFEGPGDEKSINRTAVTEPSEYRALFAEAEGTQLCGEASPNYLYVPEASENIARHAGDVRLIVSLRQPANRAYSDFVNMRKLGFEPLTSFEKAIAAERERIDSGWGPYYHYKAKGFYGKQLERYLKRFARDQIHIIRFRDLVKEPEQTMEQLFRFLGVDSTIEIDLCVGHNASGLPRFWFLHRWLTESTAVGWLRNALMPAWLERRLISIYQSTNLEKPGLSEHVRRKLTRDYEDDILRLESLLQEDFSEWLRPLDSASTQEAKNTREI